jgi:hypothetical protein
MQEAINIIKDNFYFTWFAMLIFFGGFCFSYAVNRYDLKFFTWFPRWFISLMMKFITPTSSFIRIFLVIFLFNSISIAIYMSSGIFVILPFVIVFFTGMNIGLTVFIPPQTGMEGFAERMPKTPAKALKMMFFSTLVLVLEVVAFSTALGMGMSLGAAAASTGFMGTTYSIFIYGLILMRLKAYLYVCVPILAVSAYLEARVIRGD